MENITTSLGDEVTSSMNKTERSMDNAGSAISDGARTVGNVMSDGMNYIMSDGNTEDTRTDNRAVAGETGNYTAAQVGGQQDATGNNGILGNTWIWIIMAVVALVIVGAVWFYASSTKD